MIIFSSGSDFIPLISVRGLSTCSYIKGVNVQESEHYPDYVQDVNIGKENSLPRALLSLLRFNGGAINAINAINRDSAVGDVVLSPDILVLPRPALTGLVLEAYPQDAVLGPVVQQEMGRGLTFRGFDGERRV